MITNSCVPSTKIHASNQFSEEANQMSSSDKRLLPVPEKESTNSNRYQCRSLIEREAKASSTMGYSFIPPERIAYMISEKTGGILCSEKECLHTSQAKNDETQVLSSDERLLPVPEKESTSSSQYQYCSLIAWEAKTYSTMGYSFIPPERVAYMISQRTGGILCSEKECLNTSQAKNDETQVLSSDERLLPVPEQESTSPNQYQYCSLIVRQTKAYSTKGYSFIPPERIEYMISEKTGGVLCSEKECLDTSQAKNDKVEKKSSNILSVSSLCEATGRQMDVKKWDGPNSAHSDLQLDELEPYNKYEQLNHKSASVSRESAPVFKEPVSVSKEPVSVSKKSASVFKKKVLGGAEIEKPAAAHVIYKIEYPIAAKQTPIHKKVKKDSWPEGEMRIIATDKAFFKERKNLITALPQSSIMDSSHLKGGGVGR